MNAGRMEQFGTPEEVYARPATTFVAGFIGAPPMNLIVGRADGTQFVFGGHTLQLPGNAPRNGDLILGLRPEHADFSSTADVGWPVTVEVVETLGAERLVYCRLGSELFTVRIEGTLPAPKAGTSAVLHAPSEHLHWFDAASGGRLA
jgi:sn-glycerol 3-phosphate transport system ATP-binding protein